MTEHPKQAADRARDSDSPGIFVPPPLMFAAAVAMGVMLDGNWLKRGHVTHPIQLAGMAVAVAGLALILVSLGLFRRFKTRPEPWAPSSRLIATGLYRYSRNPMYLGMALLAVGVLIFCESLAGALFLAVVLVIIDRVVIAREEEYLSRRFGADYEGYRVRVRRWL